MEQTARAWDPDIRINDRDAMSAMPDALRSAIDVQLLAQLANVPTFVKRYSASQDNGSIEELIRASLTANEDMKRWIAGERGWREDRIVAQIRKRGSTSTYQDGDGADWKAQDQLQFRTRGVFSWHSWRRVGKEVSRASATEFASNYSGVPTYYNVAGQPGDRSLRIAAVATKAQARVSTRASFDLDTNAQPLAAAAMARVEFRRPSGSAFAALSRNQHEYANLFNPFWDAHLVPIQIGGGT
jgi:hypothetical protein